MSPNCLHIPRTVQPSGLALSPCGHTVSILQAPVRVLSGYFGVRGSKRRVADIGLNVAGMLIASQDEPGPEDRYAANTGGLDDPSSTSCWRRERCPQFGSDQASDSRTTGSTRGSAHRREVGWERVLSPTSDGGSSGGSSQTDAPPPPAVSV
jgi:hypothetical protein